LILKRWFWPRTLAVRLLLLTLVVGGCVGGCAELAQKERELTFRPVREAAGWFAGVPDGVQDVYVGVGDAPGSPRMHAWWWPADNDAAPAVFYLHGAHWNLTGQLRRIEQLRSFGFAVFAIDYRGFGESDGDLPSEETVYEDAHAGWQWFAAHVPNASHRFIYGHSLGGAIAIDLAARLAAVNEPLAGLIVESSFTTLADIATEVTYRWLPTRMLLSQKFDSLEKIAHVRAPVLIVHGASDPYVPSRFSEALYNAAPTPKQLLLVPGASHNNSMWIGNEAYQHALLQLFGLSGAAQGEAKVTEHRGAPHT
jgi:alpha-beta hydrolase superfamily lysophospholipase